MRIDTRHRHNESKFLILSVLYHSHGYLLPRQIAELTGLTKGNVRRLLSRYYKFGYICRRKVFWAGERGYMYRYLKQHGIRVLLGGDGLEFRMRIREVTGIKISLNRKKPVPMEVLMQYRRSINR